MNNFIKIFFISFSYFFIIGLANSLPVQATGPHTQVLNKKFPTHSSTVVLETLDGKLLKIEGDFYVVEDWRGNLHRLRLSNHATWLNGPKKPGDAVRVEIAEARAMTVQ